MPSHSPFAIQTASGRFVNPVSPDVRDIVFADIAHALSHICRFTGHTSRFYSVAEHSVAVSLAVRAMLRAENHVDKHVVAYAALVGLLHDAPEAYIGDISAPMKRNLDGILDITRYREIEGRLERTIWRALDLPWRRGTQEDEYIAQLVHNADTRTVFEWERYYFMGYPQPAGFGTPWYPTRYGLDPASATHAFNREYQRILLELRRV